MGTLAFDADRLRLLGTALTDASERLAAVRCDDPDGQAALAVAAGARAVFDDWAARAAGIASSGMLDDYQPVIVDPGVLFLALDHVLADTYGWTTTTDPLGDEWHVPAGQQAAALATVLSDYGARLDTSSDESLLLVQLLDVVADPAALDAFRLNLSPAGAAALADALARHRTELVDGDGGSPTSWLGDGAERAARVSQIDQIAAVLATVIVDPARPLADAQAALAMMRPYSAAMIVAQIDAGVDEVWVAALATSTLRRYHELGRDPERAPALLELPGVRAIGIGDLLFPRMATCSPAIANLFVRHVIDISPELVTHTVHDPANAAVLLTTATDASLGVWAAARVLVALIDHMRDTDPSSELPTTVPNVGSSSFSLHPHLGQLLAPWVAPLLGNDPAFRWSEEERQQVMRFVVMDDRAFADLLALSNRWLESLPITGPITDPVRLNVELGRVGAIVGELRGIVEDRLGENAAAAQVQWDLMVSLLPKAVGKGISYTGLSGVPAKVLIKVVNTGIAAGSDLAQDRGWLGAPPPLGEVLHGVAVDSDMVLATGSYLATSTMRALLIDQGDLPADFPDVPPPWDESACPSKDYRATLDDWLLGVLDDHRVGTGEHGEVVYSRLKIASDAFTAPASAALACQRLS